MPRKKKTDDIPKVEVTQEKEVANAEVDASKEKAKTDVEVENKVATETTDLQEKTSTSEVNVEIEEAHENDNTETEENIPEPKSDPSEFNLTDDENEYFVMDADAILASVQSEEEESGEVSDNNEFFSEPSEEDVEAPENEETAAELAEKLKNIRNKRTSNLRENDTKVSNNIVTDVKSDNSSSINMFKSSNRNLIEADNTLMWNGLRKYIFTGVPILCRVVGELSHKGEICAICMPIEKRFSSVNIFVPFSEMDIPANRVLTNKEKSRVITGTIFSIKRVTITSIDVDNECGEGSVRLGNMRTRKAWYFRGISGSVNINSTERQRQIITKGSIQSAIVDSINQFGINVNIFGASTWIAKNKLSYEYLDHPSKRFKVGQEINVKILDLITDKDNDYNVIVDASVRALTINKTIDALHKWAHKGNTYLATVAVLAGYGVKRPIVFADPGFNCTIRDVPNFDPYTVGSKVLIKVLAVNKEYAYADIIKVLSYFPERYKN